MTIRIKDIAKGLNVSAMTVSKALRNQYDVSEETRQRVLKRARQLGYQPNWVARSLVTKRTYMVGLVIPDLMHSFFAEVVKAVAGRLEPRGYHIVIVDSEEDPVAEMGQIEALLARKVDGLIIASAQSDGRWLKRMLRRHKTPCILIDRTLPGLEAHYVGVDDATIGAIATRHLIEQGCRRVAHIRGPAISTGKGRLRGYRQALREQGMEVPSNYVVGGNWADSTGLEAMRQLLRLDPLPDGVFCYNDPVASGAIQAILESGLNVPNDIAVVGAGNVHYSDVLRVPLSTVDQCSSAIGQSAGEIFEQCIEARTPPRPKRLILPPRLVVRESSRRKHATPQASDNGPLVACATGGNDVRNV